VRVGIFDASIVNERTFRAENAKILEDPDRLNWLPPAEVINALALRTGMKVVDVGAGTGYFSIPIAEAVGAGGRVTAVDLQQGMLDIIAAKIEKRGGPGNIGLAPGEAAATGLGGHSADIVLLANIWHELDDYPAVLAEMQRLLVPGGVLAILDWHPDREPPPGPPADHRISAGDVAGELSDNGWRVEDSRDIGRYHYLILAEHGG